MLKIKVRVRHLAFVWCVMMILSLTYSALVFEAIRSLRHNVNTFSLVDFSVLCPLQKVGAPEIEKSPPHYAKTGGRAPTLLPRKVKTYRDAPLKTDLRTIPSNMPPLLPGSKIISI